MIADSFNPEDYDANAVNVDEYQSMSEEDMEDEELRYVLTDFKVLD